MHPPPPRVHVQCLSMCTSHYSPSCLLPILILMVSLLLCPTVYTDSGGGNSQEEQVTVKGVSGQSASLPCYIDESACGAIYFLTWSRLEKNDKWTRVYVYSDDVNKPLHNLIGRARFEQTKTQAHSKREAHLVFNTLKPLDDGLYKCDVTYVSGKCPSLTYVQLKIIAKPVRAWVEHEGDSLPSGHHLSLSEGDNLKLSCSVLGGMPTPIITWRSFDIRGRSQVLKRWNGEEGTAVITSKTASPHSSETDAKSVTTLVLNKRLTRDDLNTRIECHVEHEAIANNSLDSHVLIDLNVGIKTMELTGPSTPIREGDAAYIECVAYASKPAAEILWRNGSNVIDHRLARRVEEINTDRATMNTRSRLQLTMSHYDHLNPITCEAANLAMRTPLNKSIEVSVLFAPQVVMQPQNGLNVNESTPAVSIYCQYTANPSSLIENETIWYKDGRIIDLSDKSHYVSNFAGYPILTIMNVDRNDTGHYHCTMANQLGSGEPDSRVFLNVFYPATVSLVVHPNPSSDYLLKESDNLRMICDIVDGNPRRATRMRWLKNKGETVSELDNAMSSQKELTWLSITRNMTGSYTCQALTEAGFSRPSNRVRIDVNYPPGKSIIRLVNSDHVIKGENVTLECIVNDPGKPSSKTEYHWENDDGRIYESRTSTLTIPSVRLADRGNISCAAVNEVGFGPRGYLQLIPYAPPRFINSLPPTMGINENLSVGDSPSTLPAPSVSCRVECYPLCSVSWYRDDQLIDNSTSRLFQITEIHFPEEFLLNRFTSIESRLTWNLSHIQRLDRVRDSGTIFSCITSDNLAGPAVRSDTKFQVEYQPENVRLSSSRVDVIENEMLPDIRCESDANPPASYRWISNSFYDKFTGVLAHTANLALNRTFLRDSAGTYSCIASNKHGESRVDLQVNVLYPPVCTIYVSRTGRNNQDVLLVCESSVANPNTNLEFSWTLNGTQLNATMANQIVTQEGFKSKIVVPTIDDSLYGSWTCSVRNTVGQSNPNCTLFVDAPLASPEWSPLGDESIMIISATIVAIIFIFVLMLLCIIYMMRRRRHKSDKAKRENPDGSRSPTPSSSTSRVSSSQNDLISTKSSKKTTESEGMSSTNSSALGASLSSEMYENMTFQRKTSTCMPLNGALASYYGSATAQPSPSSGNVLPKAMLVHSPSPLPPPTYDIATNHRLSTDFRRTQSARFPPISSQSNGIYSLCNDPSQSLIYAELEMTNGLPRTSLDKANTHQAKPYQGFSCLYQPLGVSTSSRLSQHLSHPSQSHQAHSSSSSSSTPPSLSTSSTTNSNPYAPSNCANAGIATLGAAHILHHYDRPEALRHTSQAYFQRIQSSFGGDSAFKDGGGGASTLLLPNGRGLRATRGESVLSSSASNWNVYGKRTNGAGGTTRRPSQRAYEQPW